MSLQQMLRGLIRISYLLQSVEALGALPSKNTGVATSCQIFWIRDIK